MSDSVLELGLVSEEFEGLLEVHSTRPIARAYFSALGTRGDRRQVGA